MRQGTEIVLFISTIFPGNLSNDAVMQQVDEKKVKTERGNREFWGNGKRI